ncbi:hypothetical protein QCA50_012489 [Cerrena zonata]|uniref:AB hydrolase-1 domain-containing protein n=1 Tax=Cerrena zonata TaxID=2478898 RepID=A0AAW0FYY6_9APHY
MEWNISLSHPLILAMEPRRYVFRIPDTGLFFCANCYSPDIPFDDGLTYIFMHNAASHKEVWEPIIQHLFQLSSDPKLPSTCRVREAWSLEWQNHGESALLNTESLSERDCFGVHEIGDVVCCFLRLDLMLGHNIVAVGHSASVSAWILGGNRMEHLSLKAAILIEPGMDTLRGLPSEKDTRKWLHRLNSVVNRRDMWEDQASLERWLRRQFPWKTWDQRVFDLYVKHAYMDVERDGRSVIVPKCANRQEVGCYAIQDHSEALAHFTPFCAQVPVHLIFSERSEVVFWDNRKLICDTSQGRVLQPVRILPGVGHWVVQEKPELVAETIFDIVKPPAHTAKL